MAEHASRIRETDDGPLVGVARTAESAVRQIKDAGTQKFNDAMDGSRELIQENPMKAVLIAAGVGALIGFMVGRRR